MIPCSAPLALLIVGDVPEINEDTIHAHVVRVGARAPEAEGPFDAVAFDLRSALVSELASVRAWPQIANLPLLLVSGRAIPDTVFSLLRADDGAVLPGGPPGWNRAELRRRLLLLLALGRARRDAQDRRCDLASGGARLPCDEVAALGKSSTKRAHRRSTSVSSSRWSGASSASCARRSSSGARPRLAEHAIVQAPSWPPP